MRGLAAAWFVGCSSTVCNRGAGSPYLEKKQMTARTQQEGGSQMLEHPRQLLGVLGATGALFLPPPVAMPSMSTVPARGRWRLTR